MLLARVPTLLPAAGGQPALLAAEGGKEPPPGQAERPGTPEAGMESPENLGAFFEKPTRQIRRPVQASPGACPVGSSSA